MLKKLLATVVATAAFAGALAGAAAPASASPEDGKGCAGFPSLPDTYVCVISVTPGAALPGTTTSVIPVDVPRFCYVAGCVEATTVNVPVPGVQPGSGVVAQLWYKGQYISIAVGTVPALPTVGVPDVPDVPGDVNDVTRLVSDTVPDEVWDVVWVPILLVFGSPSGWFDFFCPLSPTC